MSDNVETFGFQAETRQLLDLMIHSVYSNKDIFLRELISNSSDALDKRRFEAVANPEYLDASTELHIHLECDAVNHTLTVSDNGIGMTRDEVITNIGTIAKSGTREYLEALRAAKSESNSPELIGQFGVGFYSSFMVAERVSMVTRKVGETIATRWESAGDGTFTIAETERDEPGTSVTLHLKAADPEDHLGDYTAEWTVRGIVKKYSDFVAYPIRMAVEHTEYERDADGKMVDGAPPIKTQEIETLNSMKAIWLREKDEVTDDEFTEFYKHISHDWNEPLQRIQAKIEGTLEYRLLLFIPKHAPFDMFRADYRQGVHLYVKRVFIMDDCAELLPPYLRFIRGVVDSEDLSLNISRELLQQDRQIQRMRKGIVNKVLDALKKMKDEDIESYRSFWREFGRILKEGLFQDAENRETLLELTLAGSTFTESDLVSFGDYVTRMKSEQDAVYYLAGSNKGDLEKSPHLEGFKAKGYEVLLFTDPVDEVWPHSVTEYKGKPIKSAARGELSLGTEEEKKAAESEIQEKSKEYGSLLEAVKTHLDRYVKEVRLSSRLTTSLVCLVGDHGEMSPLLEQLMRSMNQEVPPTKRILEINPAHPVLNKLRAVYDQDPEAPELKHYAALLYGQAVLAEGGMLPDPADFSRLVADLMEKAI